MSSYLILGRRLGPGDAGFQAALAAAHAARSRPTCLCVEGGGGATEMYVARIGQLFTLKRMPLSGSRHATDCLSYEPPPDASGIGQVLASAISENPETGDTTLKLDFALSKIAGKSAAPQAGENGSSAESDGARLSLRGLLHYLWDQAELTRWHPGFAGKRSWGAVRRHLLQAAANKFAVGGSLQSRLYIPEVFSVDERDAINSRRLAQWARSRAKPGKPQRLMLLIAELKEIAPARYGCKAVVKHLPNQSFGLDERLVRRMERRFEPALTMWSSAQDVHLIAIATFGVTPFDTASVLELSLMAVTREWLPVEDAFEKLLVDRLVADGRSFIKSLRYELPAALSIPCATLIDCEGSARSLFIAPVADHQSKASEMAETEPSDVWVWDPSGHNLPQLPARKALLGSRSAL